MSEPLSKEVMMPITWDPEIRSSGEEVRAAMSLHSVPDVVRLALSTVPRIVLEASTSTDEAFENLHGMLDIYVPAPDANTALVRVDKNDYLKTQEAAELYTLQLGEFAYKATMYFIDLAQKMPGFQAQVRATQAQENLTARKVMGLTDIQPWGEEDYRDYGLPDDDSDL